MAADTAPPPANGNLPLTKNAKRRLKKKQQQQEPAALASNSTHSIKSEQDPNHANHKSSSNTAAGPSSISLADEAASIQLDSNSQEFFKSFTNVLSRFQPDLASQQDQGPQKGEVIYSDDEDPSDDNASDAEHRLKLSKRKQKKLQRLTVAELKQLVKRPEVVEWTDVTANDPRLLVHLKCMRNSVPIPPHWGQKRDYLQNKRGIEKPQYQLPSYIADTGIATIKDALKEKESEQSLKQKTRDRVQPKMGKMDIDYQKLYDAFFKFQHKPNLTPFGDTYYEGKEYETKYKDKKPGQLSAELIEALSIPPLAPPPWLIAMQRFGPPPNYPHLKIPGLNAPIPEGASWGFHPGGWGRPPVDEYGNPLYGDVMGTAQALEANDLADPVQKEPWGQLEPEESDEEEEEEEDEDEEDETEESRAQYHDDRRPVTGIDEAGDGLRTPSGMQSVVSSVGAGMQTPSFIELRKDGRGGAPADSQRQLYQVLPERQASVSSRFMGSERVYDLSAHNESHAPVLGEERGTKRKTADGVDISFNPDELEHGVADPSALSARYDDARRANTQHTYAHADTQGVAEVREQMQRERQKQADKRARRHE